MSDPQRNHRKAVYTVVEREGAKPRFVRLGIAFEGRDGSLNVLLDALPVNGTLHIRDFAEPEALETATAEMIAPRPRSASLLQRV